MFFSDTSDLIQKKNGMQKLQKSQKFQSKWSLGILD